MGTISIPSSLPPALLLSSTLALKAYMGKKLTVSGSLAAWLCGMISFVVNPLQGGLYLLLFYYIGMKATKYKKDHKATLVVEHDPSSQTPSSRASPPPRSAANVLCTAGPAIALLLHSCGFLFFLSPSFPQEIPALPTFKAPLDPLNLGLVACYATSLGDTLASELGVAWSSKFSSPSTPGQTKIKNPTFFILPPFRPVPPGVNGGVSLFGTLACLFGGLIIGIAAAGVELCSPSLGVGQQKPDASAALLLVAVGLASGFAGTMLDSVLGATLQASYFDARRHVVFEGGRRETKDDAGGMTKWGWDVVGNCTVNLISVGAVTVATFYFAGKIESFVR